jgi:hypothetical protein
MIKIAKKQKRKKTIIRLSLFARKMQKGASNNGALYAVAALGIIGLFAAMSTGGITPTIDKLTTAPSPGPGYTCCDTGDGPDCHPILEKQITYNGDAYALLKSNIVVNELEHYAPTSTYTPDGHKIYIGTSDHTANYSQIPGCEQGKDLIRVWPPGSNPQTRQGKTCFGIPNDELIYVCKDTQQACEKQIAKSKSPFDVYYRIKDGPVPTPLSTWCPKPQTPADKTSQQIVGVPTPGGRKDLQLETFQIQQQETSYEWDNQWCKPAVYLYPTQKTDVNVKVDTIGKLNLTIPTYPQTGWNVTAYPNGEITSNNKTYPYLYYEAALPDSAITIPTNGYVIKYADLDNFFKNTLPTLGLNQSESQEFTKYWEKELPSSAYYFIGLVPTTTVNSLASLNITPAPDTTIRVTLYFKPLDKPISVQAPQIPQITRNGFTVVEWGGIFKADKNHPHFSCLM